MVTTAQAETITGSVVGVTDGDTITVLDGGRAQHKVRLAGIDAPESRQPYGQVSKRNLGRLVFAREVTLKCGKRDRYGREVCLVLQTGQDINLTQIKGGWAWWYRKYQGEQTPLEREAYEVAEAEARVARRGLWQDPNPVPPWEWRAQRRRQ